MEAIVITWVLHSSPLTFSFTGGRLSAILDRHRAIHSTDERIIIVIIMIIWYMIGLSMRTSGVSTYANRLNSRFASKVSELIINGPIERGIGNTVQRGLLMRAATFH